MNLEQINFFVWKGFFKKFWSEKFRLDLQKEKFIRKEEEGRFIKSNKTK